MFFHFHFHFQLQSPQGSNAEQDITMSSTPLKVLYHIHPDFDTLDLGGPLEILTNAKHASGGPVFSCAIAAASEYVSSGQKLVVQRHIPLDEAYRSLADYDVLIIPGGGTSPVLDAEEEPIQLIQAFVNLSKRKDGRTRTLLSVCTGSLFIAAAGALDGLAATTHANYYSKLREITATKGDTKVLEERFVVNPVNEEKGLRIVTSGGVTCGLDSCLWLVGEIAGQECKKRSAHDVQYSYNEGIVL